jgi:serine/alanine adding enzyme
MEILELQEKDRQQWDQYVQNSIQSSVYQLVGWKDVMENCYGHKTHYLIAKEADQIVGILPVLYIHSIISGHFYTSMPGGICATDEFVASALIERVKEYLIANGAKYLILRDSPRKWELPGFITNPDHCTLLVKIQTDDKLVWHRVNKRARQLTNQAYEAGLEATHGTNLLDAFYPIYSRAMRNKGTPTLGKYFFKSFATSLPDQFNLIMIRLRENILGGGFIAPFKDTIHCTWGGMLPQYYPLHPNHLLYWETLKFGCNNGFRYVDLGRSKVDSGSYIFKKNWGAEQQPLYQQYFLNGIIAPPAVGKNMEEGFAYRLFVKFWRRLPLMITEMIGPVMRKRMPFG